MTTSLLSLSAADLSSMDRAALRVLYRATFTFIADRSVLDRSSEMRSSLLTEKARLEALAAPVAPKAEKKARAPKAPKAEVVVETAPKASKWTTIVGQLWALREGEEAVEVSIPVEKLVAMGLPTSATKFAPYWNQNPPGVAAREMGLVTSLRKGKDGAYLLIRKA
jgi:hypothetical protein